MSSKYDEPLKGLLVIYATDDCDNYLEISILKRQDLAGKKDLKLLITSNSNRCIHKFNVYMLGASINCAEFFPCPNELADLPYCKWPTSAWEHPITPNSHVETDTYTSPEELQKQRGTHKRLRSYLTENKKPSDYLSDVFRTEYSYRLNTWVVYSQHKQIIVTVPLTNASEHDNRIVCDHSTPSWE